MNSARFTAAFTRDLISSRSFMKSFHRLPHLGQCDRVRFHRHRRFIDLPCRRAARWIFFISEQGQPTRQRRPPVSHHPLAPFPPTTWILGCLQTVKSSLHLLSAVAAAVVVEPLDRLLQCGCQRAKVVVAPLLS